ncbi:unnamed protein product [Effrenium voratum]|uniref:RING-type domain-containing protein n=1 Tax=Effrenium voratum TaxID=2562239 RepID=A0AA36JTL9_9DINO|nr:unnamed protein product [Effrenium voratum]
MALARGDLEIAEVPRCEASPELSPRSDLSPDSPRSLDGDASWALSPMMSPQRSEARADEDTFGARGSPLRDSGLIQLNTSGTAVRFDMQQLLSARTEVEGPRLTREQVLALPESACAGREKESTSCSICLELLRAEDRPRMLPCQHAFHTECAVLWLCRAAFCPNCRAFVELQD